jgi:hypothetical protein
MRLDTLDLHGTVQTGLRRWRARLVGSIGSGGVRGSHQVGVTQLLACLRVTGTTCAVIAAIFQGSISDIANLRKSSATSRIHVGLSPASAPGPLMVR